jgi:hypothetical protein
MIVRHRKRKIVTRKSRPDVGLITQVQQKGATFLSLLLTRGTDIIRRKARRAPTVNGQRR